MRMLLLLVVLLLLAAACCSSRWDVLLLLLFVSKQLCIAKFWILKAPISACHPHAAVAS
jgi:hypothetical protein